MSKKRMSKNIYIKDWLKMKPYPTQLITDRFYLKICNNIKQAVSKGDAGSSLKMYLPQEDFNTFACFLTSYLEDVVSDSNVWSTFTNAHQSLYGKRLPFYKLDDYYEAEINPQDVSFLIWYFLNVVGDKNFIPPFHSAIIETAEIVFDILHVAWEYAPENAYLKQFYQIDENEDDYYIARGLIDNLLFKTYLFYPDTAEELNGIIKEIIEDKNVDNVYDDDLLMLMNDARDRVLHKSFTQLLSFSGKEWASEFLPEGHPLKKEFIEMSNKIQGYFLYKGQDEDYVYTEHIASGKKFDITMESFDHSHMLEKIDTIMYLGIVHWKKEWWFSGIFFEQPFNTDLVRDEKKSIASRNAVNFIGQNKKANEDLLKDFVKAFKDYNNGSEIAFLPSEKIQPFTNDFVEYYNNSLKLSKKEIKEAQIRLKDSGLEKPKETESDFSEYTDSGIVYFNKKRGLEVLIDVNSAFPMPENPYYNEDESDDHVMRVLMDDGISPEVALFCIDHCKSKLPFFEGFTGQVILQDLDFFLRFWKHNMYRPVPYNSTF